MNIRNSLASFKKTHIIEFFLVVILLAALPVTVFLARQQQHYKQHAASGTYFSTLPPGASLPSEADCAARVRRNPWEPRIDNNTANHTVPTAQQLTGINLMTFTDAHQQSLINQMTGNFTGTTDEIIQWVACKWGIEEDIVRAEAWVESDWHMNALGDYTTDQTACPPGSGYPGAWNGSKCAQSYGILQDKYKYNKSVWPLNRDDTAFSLEYSIAITRYCFEGWRTELGSYPAGDIWGCLGVYHSGYWYVSGANNYINLVKNAYNSKPWVALGYPGLTPNPSSTIEPTPTTNPSTTNFSLTIFLHGITHIPQFD